MAWNETSCLSQVWESMAYGGAALSQNSSRLSVSTLRSLIMPAIVETSLCRVGSLNRSEMKACPWAGLGALCALPKALRLGFVCLDRTFPGKQLKPRLVLASTVVRRLRTGRCCQMISEEAIVPTFLPQASTPRLTSHI